VPAALVTTAGIFLPSFVLVAALEPLVGRIRRSPWAGAALDGVTMAALGLMAGVTVDLSRAAITDPLTAVVAVVALGVVLRWRPNACGWCWPARSSASPTPYVSTAAGLSGAGTGRPRTSIPRRVESARASPSKDPLSQYAAPTSGCYRRASASCLRYSR